MPRAFDRGVPAVDKNPLISGTNYNDPQGIIGDAAGFFGQQLREGIPRAIKDVTGIDITGIVEFMDWIVEQFGELFSLATWVEILTPIIELFDQLIADVGSDTFPIISELVTFLSGLFDGAGSVLDWLEGIVPFNLSEVLSQFETFLTALTDRETWLTTLQTLIDALASITDFPGWVTILKTLINGLLGLGESPLADLTEWLSWLWDEFGAAVETFLKPIFTFLKWLWDQFGDSVDTLKNIFTTLVDLTDDAGSLLTWVDQIPIIGPLVSVLTGKTPLDGVALDLSTLGNWARDVLTQGSDIPASNLKGLLPSGILASIPLSNINFETPNLLSQGDFGSSGTIEANDGWVWDSSQNHSGSGGCAKVTCNGTARRLYSSQVIKVVAGDRINLSAYIKTSSDFSGSSSSIELSLVPFVGTSRYTVSGSPVNVIFNSRGSTSNAWAGPVTGSTSNATAPWTVPSGVTSVRVRLAITAAATAGSVWFDDIDLHKTGLLSGDWMQGIMGTVAADFQAIVDKVIQAIKGTIVGGTGNPLTGILTSLQSIFNTLFNIPQLPTSLVSNPLLEIAVPGLQASKITSGSFGTDRIADDAVTTAKSGPSAVTSTEIAGDAVGTYQIADDAVGTAQIATDAVTTNEIATNAVTTNEIAPDAVGTSEIATNAVTANEIANETITTSLLAPTVVTGITTSVKATTVGTGATLARISPAGAHIAAASGTQTFASSTNPFFNTLSRSTPDISYPTSSVTYSGTTYTFYTGEFVVTLPGWYLCEVGLRVNVGNGGTSLGGPGSIVYTGYYNFTPVLYRKPSGGSNAVHRWGTEVTGFAAAGGGSRFARFANSSWIVYLSAGDTVQAGYDAGVIDAGSSATPRLGFFGCDNSGNDSYFSIALLNRS